MTDPIIAKPLTRAEDWVKAYLAAMKLGQTIRCFRCTHCNVPLEVSFDATSTKKQECVVKCPSCEKLSHLFYCSSTLLPATKAT